MDLFQVVYRERLINTAVYGVVFDKPHYLDEWLGV